MLQNEKGILLKKVQYSENNYILKIFTSHRGLSTFSIRIKAGKESRYIRNVIGQPMSIIEYEYFDKVNKEIKVIKSLSLHYPFKNIPINPIRQSVLLFMNELILQTIRLPQHDSKLYEFILDTLKLLDSYEIELANFPLWFTIQMSNMLGFRIKLSEYNTQTIFNIEKGRFCVPNFLPSISINEHLSSILHDFLADEKPLQFHIPKKERKLLLQSILDVYQFHGDFDINLNSLKVLYNLFE